MASGKLFRRGLVSPSRSHLQGRHSNVLVIRAPLAVSEKKALSKGPLVLAAVSPPKTVSKSLAAGAYLVLLPMPRVSPVAQTEMSMESDVPQFIVCKMGLSD